MRRAIRAGAATPATPPPAPAVLKSPAELAKDALAYDKSDFVFGGSMEGGVDRGIPAFTELVNGMAAAAAPAVRWQHPLSVKTPEIAPDPAKAIDNISRQLNLGVTTVVFVGVESADEVKKGLAAMRFKSKGGTRPDDVGSAPKYWGLSDKEYRKKADLWPLNADGELTNWTIIESKAGLAKVREIAAVKGISVLFPGAGTLRGVFTTTGADGQRKADTEGWEAAIQQVLCQGGERENVGAGLRTGLPLTADTPLMFPIVHGGVHLLSRRSRVRNETEIRGIGKQHGVSEEQSRPRSRPARIIAASPWP